jgi:PAS domain S-box-containing protein
MLRNRILFLGGLIVVAASLYAAVVYTEAIVGATFGLPALVIVAITGTATASAIFFYQRLERFTGSFKSSEKLLRDSESRFQQLFDISPFPATVTSLKGNRVLAINKRTAERFGIPQSQAVGLHAPDFYANPSQRDMMVEELKKHGHAENLSIELKTPSGEKFWADVSASLVTFEGEPATLAVFHDVTERVAAEQALRASEQRLVAENKALTELTARQARGSAHFENDLRDLLETAAHTLDVARVSMWSFVMHRSAIQCLDLYEQKSGHVTGQVLLRADFPVYFEALETERLIAAADAHRDPRTAHFSEPYLKRFGIGAMLDVPMRQNDLPIGVLCLEHVGAARNWTADEQNFALSLANLIVVALSDADRREAVEKLAESEARARLVVDTAHDAFIGMNHEGRIVMWNAQAAATFGWTSQEAIGQSLGDIIIPLAFREAHKNGLRRFLDSGAAPVVNQRLELTALHRSGREFPIEITITIPVAFEGGYFFGAFLRDISQRRQHEAELQRAKESAESATRAKSEFLANMSHELRTPLNGVLGYAQLLQRSRGLTSDQRESLDAIAKCGAHLLELINDVLDLSKIEAGRIEVEAVPTNLRQLTTDLRHVIAEPARRKGLRFSVEVDPNLPSRVILDGRHMRQVLLNLLGNAVKFTERGEILLMLSRSEDERLYCEVRDTGIGIEEKNLEEIFEAFRQTRDGSTAGGTGLGLTISQRLVASMGGELRVKSTHGAGSSFYFFIPLIPTQDAGGDETGAAEEPLFNARLESGEELTALVADDSSVNRRILAALLESAGVRVITAEQGTEAVSLAIQHRPDIILMDLRMRDLDGLQATRQILANPATASIPVIMVTASAFGDSRQAALEAGCVDFISKPIRAAQLFERLQRYSGVRFAAPAEEVEIQSDPIDFIHTSRPELGQRLEESSSIGNVAEIDAIVKELANGDERDVKLSARIALLASKFDFAALLELAARMQTQSRGAV